MKRTRRRIRNYLGRFIGLQVDMEILWPPEMPVIYIGNPKAGCSTIRQSLKAAQASAYERAGRAFERVPDPHRDDDCLRHKGLKPACCGKRFLFSCVRNPFARALSGYLDKVEQGDYRTFPELRRLRSFSFEGFLRALASRRPSHLDPHFRPQHINLNYPNLAYDAIFFLESPSTIGVVLEEAISGFKLEHFAPHARGAADKLASHYDRTTVELVQQIYARDFEAFGYSPDLEHATRAPGAMIAQHELLATGAGRPPALHGGRDVRALENTLRCRWLIDRRII